MFLGPLEIAKPWNTKGIAGVYRFLERVWRLSFAVNAGKSAEDAHELEGLLHETIKKIGNDIETLNLNTAISQLMILSNAMVALPGVPVSAFRTFLLLLAPFAPHLSEELWERSGESDSIHTQAWPTFDEGRLAKREVVIAVQVNGKVRGVLNFPRDVSEGEVKKEAIALPGISKWLEGKKQERVIYVPGRLINIVTRGD